MKASLFVLGGIVACGMIAGCGGGGGGSADNDFLYYVSNLKTLNSQGFPSQTSTTLFTGLGDLSEVRVSPDGTKVLYRFGVQLRVANIDGTGATIITGYKSADWNADGSKIFAITTDQRVRTMNPDLTGVSGDLYVGNFGAGIWQLDASDDGTKLAFISFYSTGGRVTTINADGSGETFLTANTAEEAKAPRWSQDGTKIVFDDGADVFVVNADGTGRTTIAGTAAVEVNPVFRTDGTVTYVSDGDLWSMTATGSGKVEILDEATPLSWPTIR